MVPSKNLRYEVEGLSMPADILVDTSGVPHIYAGTHYDTFFVQGFNAARDRLWQIDTWRRRGLGQLSEVFGPDYLEQDKAARLFLYRGDMFREWLAYGSDAKQIASSFTDGVNAYVNLVQSDPALLPPEFNLLDYKPAYWSPEDVVRIRSHGLWRNVSTEVRRAAAVCHHGLKIDAMRKKLEPPWQTEIPAGLDPCQIPTDVLRLYSLAKAPVDFTAAAQSLGLKVSQRSPLPPAAPDYGLGSNNWVVAADRTQSGKPVIANDPHRTHAVPSLRYIAHLNGPGINVIGAGEPALPGISIGHNENIAFGLTIFSIDQEDLRTYSLNDKGEYPYQDTWEAFRSIDESVKVRDAEDVTVTLQFSRHGPVVHQQDNMAFAVQAAWLEPGMAPYFGSVEYMRAQNWREFLAALNRWGAPAENQVYADVDGNIGYKPAGLAPIRTDFDGLMPVPGDGRYEWQGYYDMDQLPVSYNPERGWVGTANAMSLPDDFPYQTTRLGFEWSSPWRINRIAEVLDQTQNHTISDSLALQRDYLSIPARTILSTEGLKINNESAANLFRQWDYKLREDSATAALFEVWYSRFLKTAVLEEITGLADVSSLGTPDSLVVVEAFTRMPARTRQLITDHTLDLALAETKQLLGNDMTGWRWGNLHQMRFKHPLHDFVNAEQRALLQLPAVNRGGSGDTPNSTSYHSDFSVRSGGSWRMVIDLEDWDSARMTNAPGQSGDPRSQHYDDLLLNWAGDESLPLYYSREKVEANTALRITLVPGKPAR